METFPMTLFKHLDLAVPEATPEIHSWTSQLHETINLLFC